MLPNNKNNKISPLFLECLNNFPFITETFDQMTLYQILEKMNKKINEVVIFANDVLEKELNEYINQKFNDMIINTMYEPDTETLVLYLDQVNN